MSNDDRMKSRRKVVGHIEIHLTYTLNHHIYIVYIYIYHIYIYILGGSIWSKRMMCLEVHGELIRNGRKKQVK